MPKVFVESRCNELKGLLKNGTLIPLKKESISEDKRIFGSRFIDEFKSTDHGKRFKSRLISQNYSY